MAAAHTSQRLTEHARTHAHGQEEDSEEEGIHRGAIDAPAKKAAKTAARKAGRKAAPKPAAKTCGEGGAKSGKYVYFFGAGKADGNRTMKDLLGGKGAGLAEMTNAGLPVPPGSRSRPTPAALYYDEGRKMPAAVETQMLEQRQEAREGGRQQARSTREPAARVGALGREVLDAGHDGHHPQPRPERRRPSRG